MDFQRIIESVPDYGTFMTVDEMDESTRRLAEEFPDIVTVFEAGVSRQGHSLLCIKIGDGLLNALCFACPHPNEPIGAMTMEYFSRALAEEKELREELGYTWYIIKCIDPDGTRLNENWFKGPFDLYHYMRNYFRPVGTEQVEWTFPVDYKTLHFNSPLPETEALMKLIQDIKPKFMYSLHNAGFGGAYWYISEDMPEVYEGLYESARRQRVAISLGEPEAPSVIEFAPAIYRHLSAAQEYDYLEQYGGDPSVFDCGTSSGDYALMETGDCVTFLTELPYFFDPRIEDLSDSGMTRLEAVRKNVEQSRAQHADLESILGGIRSDIQPDNPFVKLVNQILRYGESGGDAKLKWAESDPSFKEPARVSHVFDNLQIATFYHGLSLGLSIRACEFELDRLSGGGAQNQTVQRLKAAKDHGLELLKSLCDRLEKEMNYSVIPIQKLVRIQLEGGLIVSKRIADKQKDAHVSL
ncbi:M14 family zinc carboxypeptidase [Paenibacillus jiagnxiensis]|uniref:M14 family zinc carboxypeptidase n=1 Tax=Paenibacillus jiagnxiensis TaxID=3228926 RepID=UPI0033BC24D7